MPTYQYRCTDCGNELEAVQKFTDPALTECPTCTGQLRKVFNAVGVVFKGSGFYRTDSRNDAKKAATSSSNGSKSDSGSGSADTKSSGNGSASGGSASGGSSNGSGGAGEKSGGKQPATAGSSSGAGSGGSSTGS